MFLKLKIWKENIILFFYCCSSTVFCLFPPPFPSPQPSPPPSPVSISHPTLVIVHVSFLFLLISHNCSCKLFTLFPCNPLPSPLWSLSACSQFQCLWLYFACLFVLLIRFHFIYLLLLHLSGYCQFVLNFNVSGSIFLACLFCWLVHLNVRSYDS